MKKAILITACLGATTSSGAMASSADVQVANPASAFCQRMRGRIVIAKLPSGDEIGLCYLPNKKIVEEWTLFRMLDGKKPAARNNPDR